jgi:polar amino acid transport system permease protein
VIGMVIAALRVSPVPPLRAAGAAYTELFRNTPLTALMLLMFFVLPVVGFRPIYFRFAIIALSLYTGAFMGEAVRSGINAVNRGQVEAARSLGMSPTRAMISIVIPQALRTVLPPLTNELILLTKDSSLAFLLGTTLDQYELAQFGRAALNQVRSMTPLLLVGLCYLIITIPLSFLARRLERRYGSAGMPKGAEV